MVMGPACLLKTSALDGLLVLVTDCGRLAEPRLRQIQVHGMKLNTCIWEDVKELSRNFPPSPAGLTTPSATRSTGQLEDTQVGGSVTILPSRLWVAPLPMCWWRMSGGAAALPLHQHPDA